MKTDKLNKFSFILYDKKQPPRYFEIRRGTFRFLFLALPFITIISLSLVTGIFFYFDSLKKIAEKKEPAIINKLKEEKGLMDEKVKELEELNNSLQAKLTSAAVPTLSILSLFHATPGMEDKTHSPLFSVEEVEVFTSDKDLRFRFNIVNINQNNKLAGYVFVIMKDSRGYYFHPANSMDEDEMQFKYNQGESFATTRFRPVEASFPIPAKGDNPLFKILIFNRVGDLIHKKIVFKKIGI